MVDVKVIYLRRLTSLDALRVVAELWRSVPEPDTLTWEQLRERNIQTLQWLEEKKLLCAAPDGVCNTVANEWRAPLYPLDLTRLEIDAKELRDAQARWVPADFY